MPLPSSPSGRPCLSSRWPPPFSAAGCTEEFDPYNRLTALRVLAIRSEPPTARPGRDRRAVGAGLRPGRHRAAELRVELVPAGRPRHRRAIPAWSAPEQAAMLEQAGVTLPPFDLGAEPTASFTHTVDPALLSALCDGTTGVLAPAPELRGRLPGAGQADRRAAATRPSPPCASCACASTPPPSPTRTPPSRGCWPRQEEDLFVPITEQNALTLPRDEETVIRAVVPGVGGRGLQRQGHRPAAGPRARAADVHLVHRERRHPQRAAPASSSGRSRSGRRLQPLDARQDQGLRRPTARASSS